jgi:hypothetical protein
MDWLLDLTPFTINTRGIAILGCAILVRECDEIGMVRGKHILPLLEHEFTHIERQRTYGRVFWTLKWLTDKGFRGFEEQFAEDSEDNFDKNFDFKKIMLDK